MVITIFKFRVKPKINIFKENELLDQMVVEKRLFNFLMVAKKIKKCYEV